MKAVLEACREGKIDGKIVFAGSDNPAAAGLKTAADLGAPTFVTNYASIIRQYRREPESLEIPSDFNLNDTLSKQSFFGTDADPETVKAFFYSRAVAEAALLEQMKPFDADLLVLAGFMRTLTPYFIDRINADPDVPRIMNIHPALLPAFPGADGYGDTFRHGCKIGGCTVHFIDYGEDTGPIIGQRAFQIHAADDLDSVKRKGLALEWQLYPECIQLYAQGRLKVVRKEYASPHGRVRRRRVVKILTKKEAAPDSTGDGA